MFVNQGFLPQNRGGTGQLAKGGRGLTPVALDGAGLNLEYGLATTTLQAVLDFPNILANTTSELTINVAPLGNVTLGDIVIASPLGAPEAGLVWSAYVSTAGTNTGVVTVRVANVTAAPINPGPRTWRVQLWLNAAYEAL